MLRFDHNIRSGFAVATRARGRGGTGGIENVHIYWFSTIHTVYSPFLHWSLTFRVGPYPFLVGAFDFASRSLASHIDVSSAVDVGAQLFTLILDYIHTGPSPFRLRIGAFTSGVDRLPPNDNTRYSGGNQTAVQKASTWERCCGSTGRFQGPGGLVSTVCDRVQGSYGLSFTTRFHRSAFMQNHVVIRSLGVGGRAMKPSPEPKHTDGRREYPHLLIQQNKTKNPKIKTTNK